MEWFALLAVLFLGGFALLVMFSTMIRVVREYERLVVFRLGRCIGMKGPGLILLIPFIERPSR